MRKLRAALLAALMLGGSLPAAARDRGFQNRGMQFRNHDRGIPNRFVQRHPPRFFRGGGVFFVPAPAFAYPYPGPLFYWYCANPPGYYPSVVQCFTAWQAIAVPQ